MGAIRVGIDDLIMALDDHTGEAEWYLDRETGAIVRVADDLLDDGDEAAAQVEAEPERFILIEPLPSRDGYAAMADFAANVADATVRSALERALAGSQPFRAFKNALLDYPQERECWFRFKGEREREAALAWLAEQDIAPPG